MEKGQPIEQLILWKKEGEQDKTIRAEIKEGHVKNLMKMMNYQVIVGRRHRFWNSNHFKNYSLSNQTFMLPHNRHTKVKKVNNKLNYY